jgi:glycosyltransferase involved in cell wall biosynthesis
MRVCIVGELTGGVGVYGQNLIRGLAKLGVDLTVITPTPEHAPAGRVLPVRRTHGRGRWIPHALAFARALRPVRRDVDLVHFTDARYALFAPRRGGPLVGTMNDYFYAISGWLSGAGSRAVYRDWMVRHLYYNTMRLGERLTFPRLDRIVCISRAVTEVLASRYALARERLPVVHYGIDFGPADAEPLPGRGPVILFAGGNFQRKGLGVLVRAAPAVLAAVPEARFVVVGSAPDAPLLRRLCRELRVEHAFELVGQVDYATLYRYYRSASVYAMPSLLEAFGIPYLEAMHCGVPVLASDVAGPDDYLVHGRNALVAPVGDVDTVAGHLIRLLGDPQLREALVREGRKTAAAFTVEKMARETLDVYRSAADTASAAPR